jgi:glycosyltransferase involved in cell wall biosynthesis
MPRLLYLVTEDWYFLSHRLPMARTARAAGFEVHVATRVVDGGATIEAEGFHLHPLTWRRGTTNPFAFASAIAEVRRTYRSVKPDLIHLVALWPAIVGSVAALGLPMKRLSALTGLGFAFTSNAFKARAVRTILRPILRQLLTGPSAAVLIQNPDDLALMTEFGLERSHLFLIPGSGVDADRLRPLPEPSGPVTMAYAGRLLDDKGLRTLVTAQALLRAKGDIVRLLIAGEADPANPTSIPEREINAWRHQAGVEVLGHVDDIGALWARAHIAVLPSRREGLPKSLLEAAACGRPLVATDVPGCRQVARRDNALLVPPDDAPSLAAAIHRLADDPSLRTRFGVASRALVEAEFATEKIGPKTVELYRTLLSL